MKIQCEYSEANWPNYQIKFYCCSVKSQQIPYDEEIEFDGNHLDSKTKNDVTCISFESCTMEKFPKRISRVFPNLNIVKIYSSKLKTICKNDLSEIEELKIFDCYNNDIEYVPGNLFEGLKHIEWIRFNINKQLKIIEPNLLDITENLKHVDLLGNFNHNIIFSHWNSSSSSISSLEAVKSSLAEKFFVLDLQIIKNFILEQENISSECAKFAKRIKNVDIKIMILELRAEITEKLVKKIEKGVLGDLRNFIQNENLKDFKIIIEDKEYMVHKFLISTRCPTLAEKFFKNPKANSLKLTDISEKMFEKIPNFFYNDELPGDDGTNFIELFTAAGILQINELKNCAVKKILENINTIDALELLQLANKYNHDKLIQAAFQEVKKRYPKIDFKEEWSRDPERANEIIVGLKKKEAMIRKAELEFENLITYSEKLKSTTDVENQKIKEDIILPK